MPKELNFVCVVKFTINGNATEVVQSWPHLGHIITSGMDDISDIDRCRRAGNGSMGHGSNGS